MIVWLLACTTPDDDTAFDPSWSLVWSDSFEGAAGTAPDPDIWTADVGGDGWGNNQLEYDTDRLDNAALDGDGRLAITARRENYEGNAYTSARLTTKGAFTVGLGRVEADLQMPAGDGLWPAFWMLGADYDDVGWPACGEIDIMELRGSEPDVTLATVHGPGYSGSGGYGDSYRLRDSSFSEGFHTFAVDIDPDHLTFWMDDKRVHVVRPGDVEGAWAFDGDFFLIANLAVGGNFLEDPTPDTPFPATFLIDEVRVYERANTYP